MSNFPCLGHFLVIHPGIRRFRKALDRIILT